MLIGVDASRAVLANKRGAEYYGWYLLKELLALDTKNRYRLYAPHLPTEDFGTFPNAEWKILPARRLWSQYQLAKEVRLNPPDVLFVPSHVVPLFSNVPTVVTIHDLAYKYFPKAYTSFSRRYLNFSTGVSVGKARRIIVPSTATAEDVLKYYKIDPKRIAIIPHGYDAEQYQPKPTDENPPIADSYMFFVGRVESRKNVTLLVDAFALLAKEIKNIQLVIAGKPGEGYELVTEKINALPEPIRCRIIQTGYLSTSDSARYMRHAEAFVFPSLYEGFGLPLLEAMASGTPVIASSASCLPEVAGQAAILLPPQNALSWAAAMSRVVHQKDVADKMRAAGLERVKNYSWRAAAKQTLAVLNDAVQK